MHEHITPDDLALFLAIDRAGTLTGAASSLGLNQSTVSRRLSELEGRLGAALFARTRDGAHATALGRAWREPADAQRRAVAEARAATAALQQGVTGEVRLATPVVLADQVLLPALPTLLERHPSLSVQVLATPDVADLARLEADLALRFVRPKAGELVARRVLGLSLAAYAAPGLPLPGDLRSWPWLGWADARMSLGESAWQESMGITPRVRVLAPTSMFAAVRAGVGVALLPRALARFAPELVEVQVPAPRDALPVFLVAHRAVRDLPRVAAAWDWVTEVLSQGEA